ncbi:hypothetical protein V7138_09125 [Bacillus sp. JJ1533]|uniref:hypothetical protein n=1 Tax=Bacillus sp. JJ1533 TaxID=3122959 RepID=UPI0030008788
MENFNSIKVASLRKGNKVTKQGDLKMVDLVSHFTKKYEIPQLLLANLIKLGLLSSLLEQVKKIDRNLIWKDDFQC